MLPSWGKVLVTTVRLWAQRRGHLRWPAQARWRVLTVVVLAAVLFRRGCDEHRADPERPGPRRAFRRPEPPRPQDRAGAGYPRSHCGRPPRPAQAAARWIAAQVLCTARSCPATRRCARRCRRKESPRRGSSPSARGDAARLGRDLIVSTAAVRSEFGARLASVYAPVVLASFGTGSAQAAIRVVAADGAAASLRGLRADVAARTSAGRQLLPNPRLHSSASARVALAAGQVDSRLLTAFAGPGHDAPGGRGRFSRRRSRRRGQRGHAAADRGHRVRGARHPEAAQLDGLAGQFPVVPELALYRPAAITIMPAGRWPAGVARRVRRAQPSRTAREGLTRIRTDPQHARHQHWVVSALGVGADGGSRVSV